MTEAIKPDKRNYRVHNQRNQQLIAKSLKEYGAARSIVVDNAGVIIGGNATFEQAGKLKIPVKIVKTDGKELVAVQRTDIKPNDPRRRQLAIMDNSTSDSSEFDMELLEADFDTSELADLGIDLDFPVEFGENDSSQKLSEKFIVPPFSIFDTRQGYWQERKRAWLTLGIASEVGRKERVLIHSKSGSVIRYYDKKRAAEASAGKRLSNSEFENEYLKANTATDKGVSIFDPVLSEIIYRWFNVSGGKILDPFAGGSVRGIVAGVLGYPYTGVDLRKEQIAENEKQAKKILKSKQKDKIKWLCGNSKDINSLVAKEKYDLLFSCPPYFDLENYSDDPDDLSNMGWKEFCATYKEIVKKSSDLLKNNRFACFVVSEIRDKNGVYRNLVDFTKKCFIDSGLNFYNEIILINQFGSLPVRVTKQFQSGRKVGRIHQNILVFYKGSPKEIKNNFKPLEGLNKLVSALNLDERGDKYAEISGENNAD
jgi:hypothetical protein